MSTVAGSDELRDVELESRDGLSGSAFAELIRCVLDEVEAIRVVARGSSMWPTIRDGEHVELRRAVRPPVVGEIVLVRDGERVYLHRIRHAAPRHIVCRGDNCLWDDRPVARCRIIAVARRDGWIRDTLGRLWRFACIIRRLASHWLKDTNADK